MSVVSRELQREDGVFATRDEGEDGVGVRHAEWRKREKGREREDGRRNDSRQGCGGKSSLKVKYKEHGKKNDESRVRVEQPVKLGKGVPDKNGLRF